MVVSPGYPYKVVVCRKSDGVPVYTQWFGAQNRCSAGEEFEEMVSNMITAKGMKSLPEKIIQVKDMRIFIAYRRDDSTGVVHFVFTPLKYNKSILRKLLKGIQDAFNQGLEEAGIDDHRLAECPANDLNKRSIIKKSMTAAVDMHGEGVPTSEKIMASIDKNKELMSETIDDTAARNDTLEEQVEMSDEVAASAEGFAEKTDEMNDGCCVIA